MCHGQILGLGLRVALSPKYSLRLATYHSDMDSMDLKEKQSSSVSAKKSYNALIGSCLIVYTSECLRPLSYKHCIGIFIKVLIRVL
jgi:hypothetical protein